MKKTIAFTLFSLAVAFPARAQWIVYDPASNIQQILNTAQEIAKYVEMIDNQVQQIQALTDQLNEFKRYEALFGDPAKVLLLTLKPLTDDLRKTELGKTLTALETTADATAAMLDSGAGLFQVIGKNFTTPGGNTIARRDEPYRPVAAIQETAANYRGVSEDASARRVALKAEIAETTDSLKSATTDAEVQKLTGVLVGLSAALDSTDHEVSQATASALVQDIANRADDKRQVEARKEQQHAEFSEAVDKYGKTFRLLNAPVDFPTN
ncbi:MAG: hypothetical protein ABI651_10600 [Verrucomicrobiota bacterium]